MAIGVITGCAMTCKTTKTEKGEIIATDALLNDKYFKDYHLVKVAVDKNQKSSFYGVQATYMNEEAFKALENGTDFPNESKVVLAFFSFFEDPGATIPEEKMWSAMMWKTEKAKSTGGWGYSSVDYKTLEPKLPDAVTGCYTLCHSNQKSNDSLYMKFKSESANQ